MDDNLARLERQSQMMNTASRTVAFWENIVARDLDSLARIQERINVTLNRLEAAKVNQMLVDDLLHTENKTDG